MVFKGDLKKLKELKILKLVTNFREISQILNMYSSNSYWKSSLETIDESIANYIPTQIESLYFPNGLIKDSTQFLVQLLNNYQDLKNNNKVDEFIESMFDWRNKTIQICTVLLEGYENILIELLNYFDLMFNQLLNLNSNTIDLILSNL